LFVSGTHIPALHINPTEQFPKSTGQLEQFSPVSNVPLPHKLAIMFEQTEPHEFGCRQVSVVAGLLSLHTGSDVHAGVTHAELHTIWFGWQIKTVLLQEALQLLGLLHTSIVSELLSLHWESDVQTAELTCVLPQHNPLLYVWVPQKQSPVICPFGQFGATSPFTSTVWAETVTKNKTIAIARKMYFIYYYKVCEYLFILSLCSCHQANKKKGGNPT
jgi:hypothetical protein